MSVESGTGSGYASNRRARQRSDMNSWESTSSDSLNGVEHTCERFRVGAPPLQRLPLGTDLAVDASGPDTVAFQQVEKDIHTTIDRCGIQLDDYFDGFDYDAPVGLCYRNIPGEDNAQSRSNLTLLIHAIWEEGQDLEGQWRDCVQALRDLLTKHDMQHITVEMISYQHYRDRFMAAVNPRHPALSHLTTDVYNKLQEVMDTSVLRMQWRTIDTIHIGYISPGEDNPVVISVTVDFDVNPQQWAEPKQKMRQILANANATDVEVEFDRGDYNFFSGPGILPTLDLPYNIRPGIELGCPGDLFDVEGGKLSQGYGTLGVILRAFKNGEQQGVFGLTCYHILRPWFEGWRISEKVGNKREVLAPKEDSPLDTYDKHGFFSKEGLLNVVSPTEATIKFNEDTAEESLRNTEELRAYVLLQADASDDRKVFAETEVLEKLQRQQDLKLVFRERGTQIGKAVVGSGYMRRTATGSRLDWALIKLDESIPISMANEIDLKKWPSPRPIAFNIGQARSISEYENEANSNLLVYKNGATTGRTIGHVNPKRSRCSLKWYDSMSVSQTQEHAIVIQQEDQRFSSHGDSGAAIFDKEGKWLGILHSGCVKSNVPQWQKLTYFTPALDVLADLKKRFEAGNKNTWDFDVL